MFATERERENRVTLHIKLRTRIHHYMHACMYIYTEYSVYIYIHTVYMLNVIKLLNRGFSSPLELLTAIIW